jgi:hypothetical protein
VLQQKFPNSSDKRFDRAFDRGGEHVTVDLTETARPNKSRLKVTLWLIVN